MKTDKSINLNRMLRDFQTICIIIMRNLPERDLAGHEENLQFVPKIGISHL